MRNLLDFLFKYSSWIVFSIYVIVSCVFLFDRNPYQHHVYMTSAGTVASGVYDMVGNISSYFNLRSINEDLQVQNARLAAEVAALRERLNEMSLLVYADTMTVAEPLRPYTFVIADVVNNSIHRPRNYITLNRGSRDGIRPEMGVVDQNGVVGIVSNVTESHARVISLLNPDFRLSCKVKGNDAFGSLVWDGRDYSEALLEELPRHTVYQPGDTVITSGYSAVFPEGIAVGTVIASAKGADDNFFTLRIKLLTDFSRLSTVRVISSDVINEIREVEGADNQQTSTP